MRRAIRSAVSTFLLIVAFALTTRGAFTIISFYKAAPSPVRHAADRLSQYTGIPVGKASGRERSAAGTAERTWAAAGSVDSVRLNRERNK